MSEQEWWVVPTGSMLDIPDGTHIYWSTHCRHGNCDACAASELTPDVPRRPAQCKTCGAQCVCACHKESRHGH